jgi:hypothetical protein
LQKLLQTQTVLAGEKPDEDTKPSVRRMNAEPEKTYAEESFLSPPAVHKLFEDLDVAPNAASLQADRENKPASPLAWAFPVDNPGD